MASLYDAKHRITQLMNEHIYGVGTGRDVPVYDPNTPLLYAYAIGKTECYKEVLQLIDDLINPKPPEG